MERLPSKRMQALLPSLSSAIQAEEPALITKAISSIKLNTLEREYQDRSEQEGLLLYWRARYREEMKKPEAQRDEEAMKRITATGLEIRATIEAMPERPPLRALVQVDEGDAVFQIGSLICWLMEQLNISNSLTDHQIENSSLLIIESFPSFRLEDIALVMRNALKGKYGAIYNRLDVSIILEWCGKHQQELNTERQARQYNAYLAQKESRHDQRTADYDRAQMRAAAIENITKQHERQ